MGSLYHYFRDLKKLRSGIMYIAIAVIVILFSLTIPGFFSLANALAVLTSMAVICVMGLGVTFVLTAGEIDISTGAILSLPSCIMAVLLRAGFPLMAALVIALAVTLILGFLNGLITVRIGLPSFITTLGISGLAMGMTRTVTSNTPVKVQNKLILNVFGNELFGIPLIILWMILLTAVAYFILHKTKFGRSIHCVGDNREAALLYGINVKRTIISAFVVCVIFCIFAGFLQLGRSTYASAGIGESLVLNAIVAPVIGGTSISGGKGSIIGTFVGAVFLTVISNGLFILAFPPWLSNIIIGIIVIVVLTVSGLLEKREREIARK